MEDEIVVTIQSKNQPTITTKKNPKTNTEHKQPTASGETFGLDIVLYHTGYHLKDEISSYYLITVNVYTASAASVLETCGLEAFLTTTLPFTN